SRDGDPQLHVHLAILNAMERADGADDRWRAVDGQHFYQLRHLYGVTVDREFEQRLLAMGYAMTGRADGNGAEVGGGSQQVMDRFSSRARAIDGRLRTWVDRYTARHGTPASRRTIYLMGQQIGVDGTFVMTFAAPLNPTSDDPLHDLDMASYSLVKSFGGR